MNKSQKKQLDKINNPYINVIKDKMGQKSPVSEKQINSNENSDQEKSIEKKISNIDDSDIDI